MENKVYTLKKADYKFIAELVFEHISNRHIQLNFRDCLPFIKNWLKDLGFSIDCADACIENVWYGHQYHSTYTYGLYKNKPCHIKMDFGTDGAPQTLRIFIQTAEPQITTKND